MIPTTAPLAAIGSAADAGGAAFGVARFALAAAGLLYVLYVLLLVVLTLCAHRVHR
ncbi:hypothetical protein FHS43_005852 [Streptosporangium becharense]|uniref:Uncharacterized protein n=1 Tax=Streptosporangium becharense TaxID=1816182 RepID=A0A7W9IN15_9ACTN|nr:hypothetical protein [Streptosporangium becharense]MBB2914540.1 hypothetical protein [Streptosporangium becharense]MBB5823385.1 hypothetical protein [Streptosporangium becharense]